MASVLHLDLKLDPENCLKDCFKVLKIIKSQWDEEKIQSKIFEDGITNKILGFYESNDRGNMVLIRVNGTGTEAFLDRATEVQSFKFLQDHGCAPALHCIFQNGLCYDFVPGNTYTTKCVKDPSKYRTLISELVNVHSLPKNEELFQEPCAFTSTWKFFKQAFGDTIDSNKSLLMSQDQLKNEIELLQDTLQKMNSPVVFCHNDLLIHNIIYTDQGETKFIDYEYAAYNYQAYDIGNHFNEFAGVENADYSLYPDKEFQMKWLKMYIEKYHTRCQPNTSPLNEQELNDKVTILFKQVNKFSLVSHLCWGLWALVQSNISQIDFDYVEYANLRFSAYLDRKEEFLAL